MPGRVLKRFVVPIVDLDRLLTAPFMYLRYARDLRAYRRMPGAEPTLARDLFPQIWDRTRTSSYDAHYFFQDIWAARHVAAFRPGRHVDVGSRIDLVGFLTSLTEVVFVDIRPLEATLPNLTSVAGDVTALPFPDQSEESVSCLHVAEHIGLGRYGDPLDPGGTRKAARELARIVRPGGQLLFSLPIGKPRLQFNAHRIHDPVDVVAMFPDLELIEFSAVDDAGRFERNRDEEELRSACYACGMFRFARAA